MTRAHPEADTQRAICGYLAAVAPDVIVFAIPNGSSRTKTGRPSNAVPGLLPGAPDLGLVLPDGRAAFIEVKAPGGVLSRAQIDFELRCSDFERLAPVPHCIAKSIEDVRRALGDWGVKTRESK